MAPPPSGITTTTATGGCCWSSSGPKGSVGAAAAGVLRRRRAAPEPEPERTISSCDDAARATSFLARALLLRSGCCCFGESGIRWRAGGRDCEVVGCGDWVVDCGDREILLPPACGVVTPPRSSPCTWLRASWAPTCCAPARAGASPPGCLCLDVLEKGGDPIPSSTNVCVCPKNLPRRKVPELWGSPPRHTPRLAVPVVAPELRATVSIAYCLFS